MTARETRAPQRLWQLARRAADAGFDVEVRPRGSGVQLFLRRGVTEIAAGWRRTDLDWQGDAAGPWKATGKASVTHAPDKPAWMTLAALAKQLREEPR